MKHFEHLDHIAIAVQHTEEALRFYRDTLGMRVLFSQVMPDAPVRLTHLDAGRGVHLQLVEPLDAMHPLNDWLAQHGESLHHLCFKAADLTVAVNSLTQSGVPAADSVPRCGPNGRRSVFLQQAATRDVSWEVTADMPESALSTTHDYGSAYTKTTQKRQQ